MRSAYKKKEIFRHVSLPGSEEGHEEHLDENDCGVEGKRLKELLVNIQTHLFLAVSAKSENDHKQTTNKV